MNDPFLMRKLERPRYVAKNVRRVSDRHRPGTQQAHAQRLALDEGHRIIRQSVSVAGAQDRDDMRMLKSSGELDLPLEALGADAGGEIWR